MHVDDNEFDGLRERALKVYFMLTPRQLRRKEIIDIRIYCKMAAGVDGRSGGEKQSRQYNNAKMPDAETDRALNPELQHARSLPPMTANQIPALVAR